MMSDVSEGGDSRHHRGYHGIPAGLVDRPSAAGAALLRPRRRRVLARASSVLIQLGAILAIVVLYFAQLWRVAIGMFTNPDDRRFVIGVLIAFLPAVVIGLLPASTSRSMLFNPWVVCFTLIVGGAILLWVDQLDLKPRDHDATRFPLLMYLWIGIAQCVAMIPGVSRSGASIVAAMLLGADKRSAAEFSFFLAIPTMVGAFAYDFYKNRARDDGRSSSASSRSASWSRSSPR